MTNTDTKTIIDFSKLREEQLKTEEKLRENMVMIGGLATEYHALYYFNIAEGFFKVYSIDEKRFPEAKSMVIEGNDPLETFRKFGASPLVHPDDRSLFEKITVETVLKKLAHTKKFTTRFRRRFGDKYYWTEMEFIKYEDIDEKPNCIALGFAERDAEIRHEMEEAQEKELANQQLQKNLAVIRALADEYGSVYYVDLESGKVTPYSMDESTKKEMTSIFKKDVRYTDTFLAYVQKFVYEPDRDMVIKESRKERILEKLSKKNSNSFTFRMLIKGNVSFCEVKYVAASRKDGVVNSVVAGFAHKDKEIMARYINEKLIAEYISAFMVDLDHDRYRTYRHPSTTSAMDRKDRVWSLAMTDFAKECDPEYFELVKNIGTPDFLRSELADVDRREYLYRFPSANQPWRRSVVQVIDRKDGVPTTIVATFMGIDDYQSKIKDQEKQLAIQQKQLQEALSMAQSANRAKTTFLNNMSHDIRTPMNAIIGFTALAASHIDNKELVKDYLSKISQSSDHLLSLINDVLDMSRIESGKIHLQEKEEGLRDIIHTLNDIVQASVKAKNLDFVIDAIDIKNEVIECDKLRLNQVLLNVLSNAIKYTPDGGSVLMKVCEKKVKNNGYGTYEFLIKDTGIGMTEEFIKTIFDPFTRVNSSTVSGIEGTGLGMAITKNLIDMMGGKIDIKSEPNVGTEVTITFDFKLHNIVKAPDSILQLSGIRCLIVDDDSDACMAIAKMLKDIGIRSLWCTSGKEAIIRAEDACRNNDYFKVFIINMQTPDLDGIEITRRIKKVIGGDSPIIILSAYDWSDIEEEALEAGVTSFINKPIFPSDLYQMLEACFSRHKEKEASENVKFDMGGKKILLVEDNELNREIATALLEEFGCQVFIAEDGNIAVEKIRNASSGDYDLILMDIQMPTMNGHEATKQIRALGTEISKIPIIAMTANAFEEDRKLALDAGMNEHIAKPIDIGKLKEMLVRFL